MYMLLWGAACTDVHTDVQLVQQGTACTVRAHLGTRVWHAASQRTTVRHSSLPQISFVSVLYWIVLPGSSAIHITEPRFWSGGSKKHSFDLTII